MREIFGFLILLPFIVAWNNSCASTNTVAKTSVNFNQNMQENTLPEKDKNNNPIKKEPELTLSIKEADCRKSQSCKFRLDIHNPSGEDMNIGKLNFILKPYSADSKINSSGYINSVVDIDNLENLQVNQSGNVSVIKANQHLEKEIDIANIKWLKSNQSSWKYNDLWERITAGKYQLAVEMEFYPKVTDSSQKKERIGNVEVQFENSYKAMSGWVTVDFKEE